MADRKFTVELEAVMNISNAKNNVDALQKAFSKLKLPDKLGDNFNKKINEFTKEYEKYQKRVSEGIKTPGDLNAVDKSLTRMSVLYKEIGNDAKKIAGLDIKDIFDFNTDSFKRIRNEINEINKQLNNIKVDPTNITAAFEQIKGITKNKNIVGEGGVLNQIIGHVNTGNIAEAKKALGELEKYQQRVNPEKGTRGTLGAEKYTALVNAIGLIKTAFSDAEQSSQPLISRLNELQKELSETEGVAQRDISGITDSFHKEEVAVEKVTDALKRQHSQEFGFNREIQNIDRQIQSALGLTQVFRKVTNIARQAFQTVKELDAAMVETAVVTNFDVGDMWDMLPVYTENANKLGSTIKDVYEAATLYFQQGLNLSQSMGLAEETLKMARIGGLQAAEATDMMTAALRGFNMQINETSAKRINDVYSQLAAITASDTRELGSAMERTASIANSANMSFETTSAFLAQMIETTREAPENLGTAMKTIVARFQEMKEDPTKLIDAEGEMMDANRVDKALKTIGVNLMDTNGQFRNLDDVFLEISARWDGLTQAQQRYIATIAAGSRQQSRFIAMMQNHERVTELVEAANNSAGASQTQFNKTLEGMDAKLNKLKNAWDKFAMGLANNQILKAGVDVLTKFFTVINAVIDSLGKKLPDPFGGILKSVVTLTSTLAGLNLAKFLSRGLILGGTGWWKGETGAGLLGSLAFGFKAAQVEAEKSGRKIGQSMGMNIKLGLAKTPITTSLMSVIKPNMAAANNIVNALLPQQYISKEVRKKLTKIIQEERQAIQQGTYSAGWAAYRVKNRSGDILKGINTKDIEKQLNAAPIAKAEVAFNGLGRAAASAGGSIQYFGMMLSQSNGPLSAFGPLLQTIGMGLTVLGTSLNAVRTNFLTTWAQVAVSQGILSASAYEAAVAEGTLSASMLVSAGAGKALGAALWASLGPYAAIALAIGAIVVLYKALDKAIVTDKERMEAASKAAGEASDAYSSAAQSSSELRDNIEKIREADAGFEGLVQGTTAFNEQLIKSNELILELLKKYPMLYDYLEQEANGRLKITEEGFKAVSDYQGNLSTRAAAMNTLKSGELNAEKIRQDIKSATTTTYEMANPHVKEGGHLNLVDPTNTIKVSKELTEEEKKQVELEKKKLDTTTEVARANAVNTMLTGKDLKHQQAITSLYTDQYEERKKNVEVSKDQDENYRKYAEFYGLTYNGTDLLDNEGNKVDIDYEQVEAAIPDITVLADLEIKAESIDKSLSQIDSAFQENLEIELDAGSLKLEGEDALNTRSFVSDILSENIDTNEELLDQIMEDRTALVKTIQSMNKEQIAAILGVDESELTEPIESYFDDVEQIFDERMGRIKASQMERNADLAAMIGEAQYGRQVSKRGGSIQRREIEEQMKALTASQRKAIQQTGAALRDYAGRDSMAIAVRNMQDIYTSGSQEDIKRLQESIDGVNWDSPTERLLAYNNMIENGTQSVKEMGEELMNSSDSANLITEAFGEMYSSTQFQEAMEDAEEFMDSTGKYTAAGIMKMSESVGTMKDLIESGIVTAGGMAAALNAISGEGNLTYLDLNDNILKLISAYGQLDTVIANTHELIQNFDPGVDTGEGEDFIKEQIETWKGYYDNGEWGNPQMEAIAKLIVGHKKWAETVEKYGGDMDKVYQNLYKDINMFSDGFYDSWAAMADGANDPQNLVTWKTNEKGETYIDLELKGDIKTTDDVVQYLQDSLNITKEAAEMMLTDFKNYSWDLSKDLAEGDFEAALQDSDYFKNRTVDGQVNITSSDIQFLAESMNKDYDEVKNQMEKVIKQQGLSLNELKNIDLETGEARTDYDKLNEEAGFDVKYLKKNYGITEGRNYGAIDAAAALSGLKEAGYLDEQSYGMLYEEFKQANEKGIPFVYNGEVIDPEDINSLEDFKESLTTIDETVEWVSIGEDIAQGFTNYIMDRIANAGKRFFGADEEAKQKEREKQQAEGTYGGQGSGYGISIEKQAQINYDINKEEIDKQIEEFNNSKETLNLELAVEDPLGVLSNEQKADILSKKINKTVVFDPDTGAYQTVAESVAAGTIDVKTALYADTTEVDAAISTVESHDGEGIQFTFTQTGLGGIVNQLATLSQLQNKIKENGAYTGLNNKIPTTHIPYAGSLARGTKKGRVGPRNQGGLTLTGELGYEVAWLPDEGRSVILGASGPQMVNLPKNAVVYNHEQSKDILKKRKTISAGSQAGAYNKRDNSNSIRNVTSKSTSTTKNNKDDDKETKITINNWSIEEVIRFNLEQKIEKLQKNVDNNLKKIEDKLSQVGIRVGDVTKNLNTQVDALKEVKSYNNKLIASYQKDLKKLANGNYRERLSYTDSKGESHEFTANLSKYIKYNKKTGEATIDKNKIKKAGSKAKQEAIYNAVEGALSPLLSGIESARDAAKEAQAALDELGKKTYDAFYGWKREITEIYNLTQRIANDNSFRDRFSSYVELEMSRLAAGYGNTSKEINRMVTVTNRGVKALRDQVRASKQMISAREKELDQALNYTDELDTIAAIRKRTDLKKEVKQGMLKEANFELTAAKMAASYIKNVQRNADGSVTYNIDWKKYYKDAAKNPEDKETYDAVKGKLDELNDAAKDYNDAIKDATDITKEVYDTLLDYKKTVADLENTLLKQLEENLKKQIDNAKKLNSALTKSLKDILDTVKKRLQERRQKEDNAKTEQDIANKQQRLNLLRANTSGGNQAEIARLEKEIEDAQRSYGRTLEDQTLTKLQEQGDKASQQRERQIAIAEAQLELSKSSNKELVELWLSDPEKYKTQIRDAWLEANDFDEKGAFGQEILSDEFESIFAELVVAIEELDVNNPDSLAAFAKALEKSLLKNNNGMLPTLTNLDTETGTVNGQRNYTSAKDFKKKGYSLKEARLASEQEGKQLTYKELKEGGYTVKDFQDAGYTSYKTLSKYFTDAELRKAKVTIPGKGTIGKKAAKTIKTTPKKTTELAITSSIKKGVAAAIWHGDWGTGTTRSSRLTSVFGTKAAQEIKNIFNKGYSAQAKYDSKYSYTNQKKKKYKKYETGGLADYTGPAWLDGTPSKPEIVLNATDTKNFIQLRDILSSVMKGGAFDSPVYAEAGDTNFEININVDHIANDYDVDRIADRVKKQIVESSQYRNVNQVRRLR